MSVLAFKKAMRCMIFNLTNFDRKGINWTLSIFFIFHQRYDGNDLINLKNRVTFFLIWGFTFNAKTNHTNKQTKKSQTSKH